MFSSWSISWCLRNVYDIFPILFTTIANFLPEISCGNSHFEFDQHWSTRFKILVLHWKLFLKPRMDRVHHVGSSDHDMVLIRRCGVTWNGAVPDRKYFGAYILGNISVNNILVCTILVKMMRRVCCVGDECLKSQSKCNVLIQPIYLSRHDSQKKTMLNATLKLFAPALNKLNNLIRGTVLQNTLTRPRTLFMAFKTDYYYHHKLDCGLGTPTPSLVKPVKAWF